ncbi:RNA 2',3'-cyclic phosphodiesterase [soil metagenome]
MEAAITDPMRTFVALNLPQEERQQLHDSLAGFHDRGLPVRWGSVDSLHVTVKFLGEIEGAEISRIEDTLRRVTAVHSPLRLQIGGLGAFPSLRRATVLWVGVLPDPVLTGLQRDAELALSRLGYAREQKPFRPHITVGRTRNGSRPPDIERLTALHTWTSTVEVESLDLMRSHTDSGRARYEPLVKLRLGTDPAPW